MCIMNWNGLFPGVDRGWEDRGLECATAVKSVLEWTGALIEKANVDCNDN